MTARPAGWDLSRPCGVVAALLAAGVLAACSSSSSTTPSASPTSHTAVPTSPSAPTTVDVSTSTAPPAATFAKVTGTSTTLQFDPSFVRALYTRGVSTTAVGRAKLVPRSGGSDEAVLRVTGGRATVYGAGHASATTMRLLHAGSGLTVSTDQAEVRVADLVLSIGRTSTISATLTVVADGEAGAAKTVTLFDLRPTASLRSAAGKGVGTLTGMRAYLNRTAARDLAKDLGTTAFGTGSSSVYVGTVSVVIRSA